MNKPFNLPTGCHWRDVTDHDLSYVTPTPGFRPTRDNTAAFYCDIELQHDNGQHAVHRETWLAFNATESIDDVMRGFVFQWTDGNYGCGCNRALFMARALGQPEPEDHVCSTPMRIVGPAWLAACDLGERQQDQWDSATDSMRVVKAWHRDFDPFVDVSKP